LTKLILIGIVAEKKTAANMGFCATWAGPAIFQQRFAMQHWLWVRPLTNWFYFVIYKFRFLIYIVTWADTATNTQAAQSPGRWQ